MSNTNTTGITRSKGSPSLKNRLGPTEEVSSVKFGGSDLPVGKVDGDPDLRPLGGYGGRLSVASFNFNIPSNQGCYEHAEEHHGTESWRYKTIKFLHSDKVQMVLMCLLFLDVIILFVELLLLANFPHCSLVVRDAISCCPASSTNGSFRFLDGGDHTPSSNDTFVNNHADDSHHSGLCSIPGSEPATEFMAACEEHKWAAVHHVETAMFVMTMTILTAFMIELTISMVALTPQIFFRQFFFLLDYAIVSISLVLEMFFAFYSDNLYQTLVGILVLIRIWRFIRIGHGIVELTNEVAHKEYENLLEYTEDLRDLLVHHNIPLPPGSEQFFTVNQNDSNLLNKIKEEDRLEHRKAAVHGELREASVNENNHPSC
jgi:hypothetical protein